MAGGAVDEPVGMETTPEAPQIELVDTAEGVAEKTPEQQEIEMLRDQVAKLSGRKDVLPTADPLARPGDQNNIVVHFVADGFTALGKVWYRGDEIEFEPGSQAYKDTFNRNGESWLDLRFDEYAQMEKFGKALFKDGPWRGKSYADGSYEALKVIGGDGNVTPPSEEEISAAEKLRKKRAAPKLPAMTARD